MPPTSNGLPQTEPAQPVGTTDVSEPSPETQSDGPALVEITEVTVTTEADPSASEDPRVGMATRWISLHSKLEKAGPVSFETLVSLLKVVVNPKRPWE